MTIPTCTTRTVCPYERRFAGHRRTRDSRRDHVWEFEPDRAPLSGSGGARRVPQSARPEPTSRSSIRCVGVFPRAADHTRLWRRSRAPRQPNVTVVPSTVTHFPWPRPTPSVGSSGGARTTLRAAETRRCLVLIAVARSGGRAAPSTRALGVWAQRELALQRPEQDPVTAAPPWNQHRARLPAHRHPIRRVRHQGGLELSRRSRPARRYQRDVLAG